MFALRTFLARWLLAIMLATVFSPSFGWELVDGALPHAHPAAAGEDLHAHGQSPADHEEASAHSQGTNECNGCTGPVAAACDDIQHHCCPGHVLGHLPASLGAHAVFVLTPASSLARIGQSARFSSRVPEGLERPPRPVA